MTTIIITKEQEDLIRMLGKGVVAASGAEYIFVPYWFRKKDDQWEIFPLNSVQFPAEFEELIKKQRLA